MLLSRVADSLYWGARYLERAEDTARVVRTYTDLVIDLPTSVMSSWEPLLAVAGDRALFDQHHPDVTEADIVRFLLADSANPGSVASSIAAARENLRTTREVLPRDVWAAANDLSLYCVANVTSGVERRTRARFLNHVVGDCQRIDGAMSTLMSRDEAYEFWQLGRSIERADMTARVVGVRAAALLEHDREPGHSAIHHDVQWMGLLRSVNALQMYQRTMRAPIDASKAIRFLVLDRVFPRSVAGCTAAIRRCLAELPRHDTTLAAVDRLDAVLETVPLDDGDGAALDDAMDRVLIALTALHDGIVEALIQRDA